MQRPGTLIQKLCHQLNDYDKQPLTYPSPTYTGYIAREVWEFQGWTYHYRSDAAVGAAFVTSDHVLL